MQLSVLSLTGLIQAVIMLTAIISHLSLEMTIKPVKCLTMHLYGVNIFKTRYGSKNAPTSQALQLSIDADTGSPAKENVAAASRRRLRDICWSCSDHKPRSLIVEITTTLNWSSAAVSERGSKTAGPMSMKLGMYILWVVGQNL